MIDKNKEAASFFETASLMYGLSYFNKMIEGFLHLSCYSNNN
jgi:hypothetical protein